MLTNEEIEEIYQLSRAKVAKVSLEYKRYIYDQVNWDDRLVCIKGARGVGKTTLLRQKIRESADRATTLYISLDAVWLDLRELYNLVRYHSEHGGTRVVLDEVHYLEKWQQLIKNLYDDFPEMKFAYTGSSMLKLKAGGGDLSRRQAEYELNGLSFREFLILEGKLKAKAVPLAELLTCHQKLAEEIANQGFPILVEWERYFKNGYYPFYREVKEKYHERIIQCVNQVLESDWPSVKEVSPATIRRARKMLRILASWPPQLPDLVKLYEQLETDRKQGLKILYALEQAGLLVFLSKGKAKLKTLASPDKIFCDNPNLMYALCPNADIGSARESFVLNQLKVGHEVEYPQKGDVAIDGKWLLEIGGKGKGFDQIADLPNSFVAADELEVGGGNKIPLWLFGFLY